MKTLINITFVFFLCLSLSGQEINKQKLDSLFSIIDENNKAMGSFSVFKDGQEIYSNSIGYANIEAGERATAETKYRIGSITKTFTATVIMQLIEEGKLRLDTRLSEFYPNIPNSEKIKIEDLLRHQSGLYNFSESEDFQQWKGQEQSREDHLVRIGKNGVVFEPGERSEYSNTNYLLLSLIAEDLEKKKLSEIYLERIIKPLKLKNTYYGSNLEPAKGEALAYRQTGNWTLIEETHMSVVKGAGAIISSPTDLNKFFTALFVGKMVRKESLEKMMEVKGEFGLGLIQLRFDEKMFYGHTGGLDGFNSVVGYFPEENISIAYCSNARDMAPQAIVEGAKKIFFGKEYQLPSFKTFFVSAEDLKQYEGTYTAPGFPLKLKIFAREGQLMGQAEGQPPFPLEAFEKDRFKFDRLGVKLEFQPADNKMIFKQGTNAHELSRV